MGDGVEFNYFSSPEKVNQRHITLRMLNAGITSGITGGGLVFKQSSFPLPRSADIYQVITFLFNTIP